jgi:hypothetical protein
VLPCLAKLIAVKEPEHAADEKQDDLVKRSRHGGEPEGATPPNRSRDPAIPDHEPHRAKGSADESARRFHPATLGAGTSETSRRAGIGSAGETKRIDSVRIQTGDQVIEVPWETSQELRGRLLAARLDSLEDEFAARGTSTPIVIDLADKEPLVELVLAWIDAVGEEQAVALGGLLALRDALRADLAAPPDPPVGGGEHAWS